MNMKRIASIALALLVVVLLLFLTMCQGKKNSDQPKTPAQSTSETQTPGGQDETQETQPDVQPSQSGEPQSFAPEADAQNDQSASAEQGDSTAPDGGIEDEESIVLVPVSPDESGEEEIEVDGD